MNSFEEEVTLVTEKVLHDYKDRLGKAGLSASIPKISINASSVEDHRGELRINLYDASGLCDAIETFLFKGDQPIASIDDFRDWLIEALEDIV
jgi:hypothetical protein